MTVNGRTAAGNTPTVRAKVGQDVAFHVFGGDQTFHTFHVHGHRWKDPSGAFVDNPTLGPLNSVTARWTEDNPGRWLYHCHVVPHQMGMSGWYFVDLNERHSMGRTISRPDRASGGRAHRRRERDDVSRPRQAEREGQAAQGPVPHADGRQGHGKYKTIQAAVDAAKAGDTVKIANGIYRRACSSRARPSATSRSSATSPTRRRSCSRARASSARTSSATACRSYQPGRHHGHERRPGHDQGHDGPALQGQRVLLRQRQRLHRRPPERVHTSARTASTRSTRSAAR